MYESSATEMPKKKKKRYMISMIHGGSQPPVDRQ